MHNESDQPQDGELRLALENAQRELGQLGKQFDELQAEHQQLKTFISDLSQLKTILATAEDAMAIVTDEGFIQYANHALAIATGLLEEEMIGLRVVDILPAVSFGEILEQLQDHLETDPMESGIVHPTDANQAVQITVRRVQVQDSNILILTARDVKEQQTAKRDLNLLRRAVEVSLSGVIICGAEDEQRILMANPAFLDLTGYSESDVIGKNCRFLQGPKTNPRDVDAFRVAIKQQAPIRRVIRNYRKDGTPFWNDVSINPILNDRGDVTHFVGIQMDVSDSVDRRRKAAQTAATMRSLLNSTADGIYGVDDEGKCTFFNSAALTMLGYESEKEVLGKDSHALLHHHYPDGQAYPVEECQIRKALTLSMGVHVENEVFWHKDGWSIPVEYTSDPIEQGTKGGAVVAFRDIREKLQVQAELEREKERAEIANNAKGEFIANMSHEIRTPLSAIMSYADLLTQGLSDPAQLKQSHAIKRNADHLLGVINDILDMSKTDAVQVSIEKKPIDVAELMADLESLMMVRATEKNIKLSFSYGSSIPETFHSDGKRVRQILLNLLSNAIKFTDRGSVNIAVGADEDEISFQVEDTGIGIVQDDIKRLFEPFEQASEEITRLYGGTGLGLSISQRLAEQMDGRISVDTELHRGSTFSLHIPIESGKRSAATELNESSVTDHVQQHEAAQVNLDSELPKVTGDILLVDDLPDIRDSIQGLLELGGANVVTAADGQAAIDAVSLRAQSAQSEFDVILMDMNMPVKDGFEATRELRGMGYEGPILAVTAGVLDGDRQKCLDAGCDDYLSKPLNMESFLAKLALLMGDAAHTKPAPKAGAQQPISVLIVDDYIDVANALSEILELQGILNRAVGSAAHALEIAETLLPDVCLLDINMPDTNGRQLREQLAAIEALKDTKFVAMTGETDESFVLELLSEGFDQHLAKPVDMVDLESLISLYREPAP